ncbi:unnamed protein product [Peniophora sp. CBMAI 1063]|nr:unnamed protein product [Peniophora sp. CBMAI 1063]
MALGLGGMYRTLYALGLLTVILLWTFWRAGVESTTSLSPQGCGMSYMSPNYLPQSAFDISWTPLARRYSLVLYREAGWQDDTLKGLPVLFIPGNAGSAHQIRSVASSAARTYYEKPGTIAKGMANIRPLDFFALEHNEDLSALHGPTLEAEAAYANRALDYIASLYPKDTPIILMGHSMGGVVAASLLAPNTTNATISALVTLSAPHTLPPARLDRRITKFYATARDGLEHSPVPIVSICGGATDGMVHSEACVLPAPASDNVDAYRHTVFASALEGAWTGMGHQVSVWCDQVRRLVARALLNTAPLATSADRAVALSHALPDGFTRAAATYKAGKALNFQRNKKSKDFYPPTLQLALGSFAWNGIFMMPAPFQPGSLFTMYIGGGNAQGVGPEEKNTKLTGSVHACRQVSGDKPQGHECWPVAAKRIRRIPYVHANVSFPRLEGQAAFEEDAEEEGKEEKKSEGRKGEAGVRYGKEGWKDEITVWEADVPMPEDDAPLWIAVETDGSDGKGWLVAGSSEAYDAHISYSYGVHDLLHSPALIRLDPASMRTEVTLPRLTPSSLLVYRATPLWDNYTLCATARIPPTLEYTSPSASEAHWYPLIHADPHSPAYRPILLHSHAGAPFFDLPAAPVKNNESAFEGTQFTIYSTGSHAEGKCQLKGLSLSLDWRASAGRAATRYWPALPAWTLGVALWLFGMHWSASSSSALASTLPGAPLPAPKQTLHRFVTRHLPILMFVSYIAAHFALAPEYLLGNSGRSALAPLAPLMLFLATGAVTVVYALLEVKLYLPTLFYRAKLRTSGADGEKERDEEDGVDIRKRGAAIVAIIVAVGTIVPWQAALTGAWLWHLHTTALAAAHLAARGGADTTPPEYERLSLTERDDDIPLDHPPHAPISSARQTRNALAEHKHLLLLITLMFPFAGPGLAVWARIGVKGMTAGAGDAFRGDHAVWGVLPFVVAVEWAGRRRRGGVFEATRIRIPGPVPLSSAHAFSVAALVACARGAYAGYAAPEAAAGALAVGLAGRVGARWWRNTRARRVGLGEKPV